MIRIATRKSPLALKQACWVKESLQNLYPDLRIELIKLSTEGDQHLEQALAAIGGKGLFTKALEEALLKKEADIAVHSMKDVPTDLPAGLGIGAICKREDPWDVLLSPAEYPSIQALPKHAIVGTASLRRQCQLLAQRPDLEVKVIRGNIDTRIKKLTDGHYDAIILAAAGLKRLNFTDIKTYPLPFDEFIPCAGQGAIGIEYRLEDNDTHHKISKLNHLATQQCLLAERTLNQRLGGSCQIPIGAYAYIHENDLTLNAMVGKANGSLILRTKKTGSLDSAAKIGTQAAQDLIDQGADDILTKIHRRA